MQNVKRSLELWAQDHEFSLFEPIGHPSCCMSILWLILGLCQCKCCFHITPKSWLWFLAASLTVRWVAPNQIHQEKPYLVFFSVWKSIQKDFNVQIVQNISNILPKSTPIWTTFHLDFDSDNVKRSFDNFLFIRIWDTQRVKVLTFMQIQYLNLIVLCFVNDSGFSDFYRWIFCQNIGSKFENVLTILGQHYLLTEF